jgi:hypothetical protein
MVTDKDRDSLDDLLRQAMESIDAACKRGERPSLDPKVRSLLDAANALRRKLDGG